MRRLSSILAVGLIVALASGVSMAATYYVSIGGNDNNPGTSGSPWATLQKAANTMVAGDTTIVTNGTYVGFRQTDSKQGTSGSPITIKAQNVRGVTLNAVPSGQKHNGVVELEGKWDTGNAMAYWVVDGFVVDGGSAHRAIDTRNTNHLTVKNCTTHHAKNGTGVSTGLFAAFCDYAFIQGNISYSNTEHGCYTNNSADNGTVTNNTWYSNTSLGHHMNGDASQGGDGQMTGWLIERNTSYSNGSNGYDADGVSSSTWKNNLAYANVSKALQMTQVDGTSNPTSDRIVNNTFLTPTGGFFVLNFAEGSGGGGSSNVIENNILYHADYNNSSRGSIDYVSSWVSTLTSDYNVVVDHLGMDDAASMYSLATWRSTFNKDMHSLVCTDTNALFVNAGGNDYHLKAGSPAINAGTTLADVTTDKDGNSRPQGGAQDIGCYEYIQGSTLTITTSTLPADTVGIAYNQTLQATGGTTPYTWSILSGALPSGLSLNASSGAITGTPTTAGTASFTAKVTDNVAATASKALSIVINASISITTSSLPNGSVGTAYNQTLARSGGTSPFTWSISSGSLPAGLTLVASSGAITGTPTSAGTSNFTARVADTVGATATKALSIIVVSGLTITTSSLPADTVNIAYNQTLTASGGTTPYTWAISSGTLPTGLTLNTSSGAITGTPTAAGTSNFTARVTDNVGATATKALSIVINAALSITTSSLPNGAVGSAYNQTLARSGGTTPFTWAISSGSLPAGLTLVASSGVISGTPTASGTSNFTARVTDNVGATATKALSIIVTGGGGSYNVTLQDGLNGYAGTRDSWLNSDYPTTNYGADVSAHLQYVTPDRQLHSFDLSSIPSNATITSATLSFYVYQVSGGTPNVSCYRVLKQWDEMQATYNNRLTGTAWGTPGLLSGTDYYATAIATSGNISAAGWANFTVTSQVQSWVNGSQTNYGVMYKLSTTGHLRTYMSEYTTDTSLRPKLQISYTTP